MINISFISVTLLILAIISIIGILINWYGIYKEHKNNTLDFITMLYYEQNVNHHITILWISLIAKWIITMIYKG